MEVVQGVCRDLCLPLVTRVLKAGSLAMPIRNRCTVDARKDFPYSKEHPYQSDTMITSKITSKAQTTIPQAVREALRVREGDELAYKIERGRVIMTKAVRTPADDPFATFGEWASENDRRAYGDL